MAIESRLDVIARAPEIFGCLSGELRASSALVIAIGSIVEDLATSTSDIDLLVVIDDAQSVNVGGAHLICRRLDGRALDVVLMKASAYRQTMELMSGQLLDADVRSIEMAHKIIAGVVLHSDGRLRSEEAIFPIEQFRSSLVERWTSDSIDVYDDLIGFLGEGDESQAIESARDFISLCAEAWLASVGDTYPKQKWRSRRLKRAAGENSSIFLRYRSIILNAPSSSCVYEWLKNAVGFGLDLQLLAISPTYAKPEQLEQRDKTSIASWMVTFRRNGKAFAKIRERMFSLDEASVSVLIASRLKQPSGGDRPLSSSAEPEAAAKSISRLKLLGLLAA